MQLQNDISIDELPTSVESLLMLEAADRNLEDLAHAQSAGAHARFAKYRDDPLRFVKEALAGHLWSKQAQIAFSVVANRRTAVPSCHDVGKSATAARIAAWWLSSHPPGEAFVVTTAPTFKQVKNILWREINRVQKRGKLPGRCNQTEWYIDEQIVAFGVSPSDYDPTAFQGIHERYVLVILDEACGVAKSIWDAADTLITNEDSRILAIGNPDDPATQFAEVCKPGSGWHVIQIDALESPNFTGEKIPDVLKPLLISPVWVEEKRKAWGEDSPLYQSKVRGKFPKGGLDGLVPYDDLLKAIGRELPAVGDEELGVDVARYGEDHTVIYYRHGPVAKRWDKFLKKDTMYTVGRIVQCCRENPGIKRVKIDDVGVGGGVTDRLNELKRFAKAGNTEQGAKELINVEIVPVNVGQGPATDTVSRERFFNLRAELSWAMRERFIAGDIALEESANSDDVMAQACAIKYGPNSRGLLVLESKDDMKKRGLHSPDDWDALVLAYARPSFAGQGFLDYIRSEMAKTEEQKKQPTQAAASVPVSVNEGHVKT